MSFDLKVQGWFNNTLEWMHKLQNAAFFNSLDAAGQAGVSALEEATPKDTGLTSMSWSYKVIRNNDGATIQWFNGVQAGDENLAVMLQLGHGTGTGGYVQGIDYINPAMEPIFIQALDAVLKEVKP